MTKTTPTLTDLATALRDIDIESERFADAHGYDTLRLIGPDDRRILVGIDDDHGTNLAGWVWTMYADAADEAAADLQYNDSADFSIGLAELAEGLANQLGING